MRWGFFIGALLLMEFAILLGFGISMEKFKLADEYALVYLLIAIMLPVAAFILKLHCKSLNMIGLYFLVALLATIGSVSATIMLDEEKKRQFTGEELLAGFNEQREIFNAKPLKVNQYVCKIAELRLQNALNDGTDTFSNPKGLSNAYYDIKIASENHHQTRENHVPDNVMEIYTDKADVEGTMDLWSKDLNTSYSFSDTNYEYGCALAKDGYGVLIMGFDDEPFEAKLEDNYSTSSI